MAARRGGGEKQQKAKNTNTTSSNGNVYLKYPGPRRPQENTKQPFGGCTRNIAVTDVPYTQHSCDDVFFYFGNLEIFEESLGLILEEGLI